jgi:WD40 repeat protein
VNKETFRKTWNAKYTLRSHFDGVRALSFHPTEPVLVTASEDCTLKLWNLQKTIPAKKSASLDVEPVYTFRGHVGPVLCLAMSPSGEQCYSGALDGSLLCWNIPGSNIDPYDSYGQCSRQRQLVYLFHHLLKFDRSERVEQLLGGPHGRRLGSELAQSKAALAFVLSRWNGPIVESSVQSSAHVRFHGGRIGRNSDIGRFCS